MLLFSHIPKLSLRAAAFVLSRRTPPEEQRGETRDRCGGVAIPAPGEEIATLAGERSLAMTWLSSYKIIIYWL